MEQGAEGMLEYGAEVLMYGEGDPKKGELVDKPCDLYVGDEKQFEGDD